MNENERSSLIARLTQAKEKIEPGETRIFDFIHVINLLLNFDNDYGHNPLDGDKHRDKTIKLAESLLEEEK